MDKFSVARIRMEKDKFESVKLHAACRGESVNGFVNRATDETMKADEIARLADDWSQNHNILFRYNGVKYLAYKQRYDNGKIMQVLTDDGLYFGHKVIETEADLLDADYNGVKVWDMIRNREIEWIY